MPILVRRATSADAVVLTELAATTFRQTFVDANTPEDIARCVGESFTPERQRTAPEDAAGVVLLARVG